MTDRLAPPAIEREWEAAALSELVLCETMSQTCSWIARWATRVTGAGGALVWVPHSTNAAFLCLAASGEGTERFVRRSVSRDEGIVHQLLRDRKPLTLERPQIRGAGDPWIAGLASSVTRCLAIPLERDRGVVGLLALLFDERWDVSDTLARAERLLPHAATALARAARAEKKQLGMLHAIERLTNLYDLSKAFSSTIETHELSRIIAQKAVDLLNAEAAALWMLEHEAGEVVLAATAINERFAPAAVPEAIGAEIVGDVIADGKLVVRESLLAVPLLEDEAAIGALIVAGKHGRHPEFAAADEELLTDVARQAVRALHNARLSGAEQRVEELDALLAVSREITSTLDLDRVLKTIVNASSALISYERCAIAVMQRGNLRVGAVSGMLEVNRGSPEVRRLEELLQWVFFSGSEIAVTCDENGEVTSDRAETTEKFRVHFHETGMRSFYAALLQDDEGKLGVLSFESKEPLLFDEETKDLLQILKNQATVAVRNAQLYQQVPLAGFLKPLMDRKTRLEALPQSRRKWALGVAAAVLLLIAVPWPLRVDGPARVMPGRRIAVTAPVDGVIDAVVHREGDVLRAGDVIARLRDDGYQAALAAARSDLRIAESDLARSRTAGDPAAMFEAQARRDALRARIAVAQEQLARTEIRAAAAGVLLTPNLEERIGQFLSSGSELAVIGDLRDVEVDVAVPEAEAALLKIGEPLALKIHPYPTRTWHGEVTRIGASVHQEGKERFVLVESRVPNADGSLRAGMLGQGKVSAGPRPLLYVLLRKPARWIWLELWPLLP